MYAPYGYPAPVQQAQNVYYGNYQNNMIPGYIYPRPAPTYNNNHNDGGITYYYVPNPNSGNYYPYGPAYGTPGSFQSNPPPPPGPSRVWPIPANTPVPPPKMPAPPVEDDGQKPVVTFHRTPNDCWWAKADYIAAFGRPMAFGSGPLLTTGDTTNFGALAQPGTTVIFGLNNVDFNLQSGVRLDVGKFLDKDARYSVDAIGFWVSQGRQSFSESSDSTGNPLIARPVRSLNSGNEITFFTSFPGSLTGTTTIDTRSELAGVELNVGAHSYVYRGLHLEGLLGIRYLRLAESLRIQDQLNPQVPGFLQFQGNFVTPPDSLMDLDSFSTVNNFVGPQIGGRLSWEYQWFTVSGFAKLAIGANEQQTSIAGATTLVSANGNQTASGAVLALPSNIGVYNRAVLGIVPEFGLNLSVELTQHVRLNLGYTYLMWTHVVRPGSQYDRAVNPGQVPSSPFFTGVTGSMGPNYRFNDEMYWAHMFNLGLEVHY
jgi:hypothetical protein